jgi:hypothetical protein
MICTVVFVLGCNWQYLAVVKHVNKWIELLLLLLSQNYGALGFFGTKCTKCRITKVWHDRVLNLFNFVICKLQVSSMYWNISISNFMVCLLLFLVECRCLTLLGRCFGVIPVEVKYWICIYLTFVPYLFYFLSVLLYKISGYLNGALLYIRIVSNISICCSWYRNVLIVCIVIV